jgi:hypothetical protein
VCGESNYRASFKSKKKKMRALLGVTLLVAPAGARDIPEACVEISNHIEALIANAKQVIEAYSPNDPASLGELLPAQVDIEPQIDRCTDDVITRRLLHEDAWLAYELRGLPSFLADVRHDVRHADRSVLNSLRADVAGLDGDVPWQNMNPRIAAKAPMFIAEIRRIFNEAVARVNPPVVAGWNRGNVSF